MKVRLAVAGVATALALALAGCGGQTAADAIQSTSESSTSIAASTAASVTPASTILADDPDVQSCSKLNDEYLTLKKSTFDPIVQTETIDYGPVSATLSSYSVDVRGVDWVDPTLKATWDRVAAAGDDSANVLLHGDLTSSADALTTFNRGVNAAITACTSHLEAMTTATG